VAVKKLTTISRYTGTSFDTKPTSCPVGSTFREYDTRILYETPDGGTTWKIKSIGSSNEDWLFGKPTLMYQGSGKANWERGTSILSTHQKGGNGWVARLYGGTQTTWGSAAEMYVPVNEMPLVDLETGTTMWSWFQTATEIAGIGMVIWVHDPTDSDKRAEISMLTEVGHVELAAGWNAHELAAGNDCVWYGENTGTHDTTETAGTAYNFSQFLTDDVFSTYTIYRISFAYGFQTGDSVFDNAFLADVKINGIVVPMGPASGKHRKTVITAQTAVTGAVGVNDVVCSSADPGLDWDFEFGGTGYITKAMIATPTDITPLTSLLLFTAVPTGEIKHNSANTSPLAADLANYVGQIDFPALANIGGQNKALATPSTVGKLPLEFDRPHLYGILVDKTGTNWLTGIITITLTADMQD